MSSLAAVQADGYYNPPEWDPRKGSLKKFTGAKGHNQYLQSGIIRFELPYNSWCLSCNAHIGKGVRFNAKKVQAGSYFTTKIWEFRMKCPTCKGAIVIRTDPKNCDYEFAEGIKRREQEYDAADIGLPTLPAPGESSATAVSVDPLMALERRTDDRRKADAAAARLEELLALSERTEADNYGLNALLRKQFRGEKKAAAALEEESLAKGLRFRLAPASETDGAAAALALTGGADGGGGGGGGTKLSEARRAGFRKDAKTKFARIMGSSIFADGSGGGGGSDGGGKRKESPAAAALAGASSSSSSALVLLKKSVAGRIGSGGDGASKAVRKHEAKQAVAVKRAKLSIDLAHFTMNRGGGAAGGGGAKASSLPFVVRKKG